MAKIKTIEAECGKLPDGRKARLAASTDMQEPERREGFYCPGKATTQDGQIVCDRGQLRPCQIYYGLLKKI
jgi:hypothetical protein